MVLLLAVAIFSYLSLAVKLFNDDKLAYIYDSNSSLANLLASETKLTLQNTVKAMRLIGSTAAQGGGADRSLKTLFEGDENLASISVYPANADPTRTIPIARLNNTKYLDPYNLTASYYDEVLKKRPIPLAAVRAGGFYLQNATLPEGAPLISVALTHRVPNGSEVLIIAQLRTDQLLKIYSMSAIYSTYLVDTRGEVLLQPAQRVISKAEIAGNKTLMDIIASKTPNGAREYRNRSKVSYILAYARVEEGDLLVVSEIEKEKAFIASRRLIEKSVLFALLIVAVSIIVSVLFTKQLTGSLRKLFDATTNISQGDFSVRVDVKARDEIGFLADSFNTMAGKITELIKETADKARLERELDTARTVQETFFPTKSIEAGPLTVVGQYQPATQCGGDWWGHFTSEEGIEFVMIADAMGHGVPAALVTAMCYASCMTMSDIIRNQKDKHNNSPAAILTTFNKILYDALRGKISMTFFAAVFDTKAGTLTYANGGHNFPVILPQDPADARVSAATRKSHGGAGQIPISLNLKGTPLGLDREAIFDEKTMQLAAGDKLFLFTDGLIECKSPDGKMWGRKTMVQNVASLGAKNAADMKQGVINNAFNFFAERPLDDDITVVVAELAKDWQPSTGTAPVTLSISA